MPTLIKGGPDIPAPVLQALEDGGLVFFCGAGISMPMLPSFKGLVTRLYEAVGEEQTPEEQFSVKTGQLDRALGLLEKRLNPGELRRQVHRILTLPDSEELPLHKAVLSLAKSPEGILRLVTTNFDNGFQVAGWAEEATDSAPKLPVPKPSTWQGLVHLHGRIHPGRADRDDLILTSADFGRAYLAEGWASRFVTELFRHFTVLFVGYSVDDPVMRYMTDALAAERGRDRQSNFRPAYAFASKLGRKHDREKIEVQWKSKSVEPIFYDAGKGHAKLRKTLETWAEMHRLGLHSKHSIVRRHAQEAPLGGIVDEVAHRMAWALSESSGTVAAAFARIEPAPPLRWLWVFDHPELKDMGLLASLTKDISSAQLVSSGFYSSKLPNPSKVTVKIGEWLCRHLGNQEFLNWALEKGGWLHPAFRRSVREALRKSQLSKALRTIWEVLSSESFAEASSRRAVRSAYSLEQLLENPSSLVTRNEILGLLTPVPKITTRSFFEEEFLSSGDASGESFRDLINVDIELAGSTQADHFLKYVLAPAPNRDDVLFTLAADLTSLLAQAMQWFSLFGRATPERDPSHSYVRNIGEPIRSSRTDNWPHLLQLAWDSFLVASHRDERLTTALLAYWSALDFPIFRRLLLHATTETSKVEGWKAVDVLLERGSYALWASSTQREVLRFLQKASSLDQPTLDRLLEAIKRGPQEERPPSISDHDWERYHDHDIWTRAYEVQRSGVNLSTEDLEWIAALRQRWGFTPPEEEDIEWITSRPTLLSQYDQKTITSFDDEKLIGLILTQRDNRSGFLQDWRHLVQNNPAQGVLLLKMMAQRGEWPADAWETALFGFRDSKKARSRVRLASLLRQAPAALFEQITRTLSQWLHQESKALPPKCQDTYWALFGKLWRAAVRQPADIKDPVQEAVNHPAGILTESLIQRLAERKPQKNELIPQEIKDYCDRIAQGEGKSYVLARVILVSQLHYLDAIDPEWTRHMLIPRMDWEKSSEALSLWEGYLWNPRIDPDLFQVLKKFLLQGLERLGELGEGGTNLIRLLSFMSLEFQDSLTRDQTLRFLRVLDSKRLAEVATTIRDFLEGAGEQSSSLWRERVGPWLQEFWPRRLQQRGPDVSLSLVRAAMAASDAFPEAVSTVSHYLVAVNDISSVLFGLEESEHPDRFPEPTLLLLDTLLPHQEPHRLWGYQKYLSNLLSRIRDAKPNAVNDLRYRRVEEFIERSDI